MERELPVQTRSATERLGLAAASALAVLLAVFLTSCRRDERSVAMSSRTLRIAVGEGLHGFSLDRTRQFYEANFATLVFEGLTAMDSIGRPIPSLATRWQLLPDRRTWRFTLRRGVRFHDGASFGAADVVRNWESRLRVRHDVAQRAWMLDAIDGAAAVSSGDPRPLRGLTIVNDSTLEVRLTHAAPRFVADIASPEAFIGAVRASDSLPIGTGPWRWVRGAAAAPEILLARNGAHWARVPRMDSLLIRVLPDSGLAAAFGRGDVDCTWDLTRASRIALSARTDVRMIAYGAPGLARIIFHLDRFPAFRDVRLRQAFAMALDRPRLARDAAAGPVTVASGPLPPGVPGYDVGASGWPYDPERARRLLVEAGFDFSRSLPVLLPGPNTPELAPNFSTLLIAYWEAIGVRVEEQAARDTAPPALDLHISYPEVSDADAYLYSRFQSSVAGTAGNIGAFSDAVVDRLLDEGRATEDGKVRERLMRDAARRIDELAANVFLWYNPVLTASSTRITACTGGGPRADFVSVDLAGRGVVR